MPKKTAPLASAPGSRAANPDLDWSQVRETILMLELATTQIETAMKDSDGSIGVLTESFTAMMDTIQQISDDADTLPGEGEAGRIRQAIGQRSEAVIGQMQSAVIAFQFYDKLSQRLSHVSHSIGTLAALISSPAKLYNPAEWQNLQSQIRSKYTMEEERQMFDAIVQGMSVSQALEAFHLAMREKQQHGDDIELF